MKLEPKGWKDFQHYKDRSPVWIKLHKNLLDNYEFQCLPVASKALAPMLWLLASEYEDGVIEADPKKIAFRLRMGDDEFQDALKPLCDNGFFTSDSNSLARRRRSACLETEIENKKTREENKRETETDKPSLRSGYSANGQNGALKKSKTRIPENFEPNRQLALDYWKRKGRPDLSDEIDHQAALFKAHHTKLGSRFEDWDCAWVTWYSRAIEMTRAPQGMETKSIVIDVTKMGEIH